MGGPKNRGRARPDFQVYSKIETHARPGRQLRRGLTMSLMSEDGDIGGDGDDYSGDGADDDKVMTMVVVVVLIMMFMTITMI
jgi:hypothetical protein